MKRWRLLLLLTIVALAWLAGRDFLVRNFGRWPAIRDPARLVSDCDLLMRNAAASAPAVSTEGTQPGIPSSQWPVSIATLRPRSVTSYPNKVDILISTGGIGPSFGYLIIARVDDSSVPRDYFYTHRYKERIYFWEDQF